MTSQVMEFSTRGCYSSEMLAPQSPGRLIRSLRTSRRLSQEALAHRAGVSTRHLSCLESGRSRPSRTMLLGLGEALDLPLRDRNTLLVAAGFAPVFRMSPLEDPAMNHIHHAVEQILRVHEPHPAMLLDRHWNILRLNEGALRVFQWCGLTVPMGMPLNAYRAVFDPSYGLRSAIANFEDLADVVLRRLRVEADVDPDLRPLLFELDQLRGEKSAKDEPNPGPNPIALPIRLRKG
ncbi:MAG: helix-turn-helix domain-containing protein, partial [Polyangiaceae bacterium]|nr:helix-turn-helix domain-containing protein [Polyangiaceae bacterium]